MSSDAPIPGFYTSENLTVIARRSVTRPDFTPSARRRSRPLIRLTGRSEGGTRAVRERGGLPLHDLLALVLFPVGDLGPGGPEPVRVVAALHLVHVGVFLDR